jgi:hypothetical protein
MKIGTTSEAVPVTGLAANFSPIPLIAPPPLGSDRLGIEEFASVKAEGDTLLLGLSVPAVSLPGLGMRITYYFHGWFKS